MQKKRKFLKQLVVGLLSSVMLSSVSAGTPLWTFEPLTPVDITITKGSSAQVSYMVRNQSTKPKVLIMRPIAGITSSANCQLPAKGSCTLVLNVNGSAVTGDVLGGPVLCEQGNLLQCYQPGQANILRIHLSQEPPVSQYTVTPSAGADGSISPATAQVVNAGSSLTFTATPDAGFGVSQWLVDGNLVQTGGPSYQLNNIQANHTVQVTFGQATLSPLVQELTLSVNNPSADPTLPGTPRIIQIQNTGSVAATGLQVDALGLPGGTSVTGNTCTGTPLNPNATCDITITPGANASLDAVSNPCTTSPGLVPVPTVVTVSADNASSTAVNVLVLGYGCIYQGGYLFSVNDSTPDTGSIGGKVVIDAAEGFQGLWTGTNSDIVNAMSDENGAANTDAIVQDSACTNDQTNCAAWRCRDIGDWYLPAKNEMQLVFSVLCSNGNFPCEFGQIANNAHWTSSQVNTNQATAWDFPGTSDFAYTKDTFSTMNVRCIHAFTP